MKCNICEVGCEIGGYSMGRCGTYICAGDSIVQYPGMGYLGAYPLSIEAVPVLHYYPSGKFLQVFSTGCNFQCSGCMSRVLASSKPLNQLALTPSQVIKETLKQDCLGVVSTLNEPAANYYLFRDLAVKAKEEDLLVGCSTNCYFTEGTLEELAQYVDFMNVGIKGYSDWSYMTCGAPSAAPVFRNISRLFDMGVHVETSVIFSKGNKDDILKVAEAISDVSPSIPLHVMRFLPFGYAPIKLEPSVGEAEKLCTDLRKHIDFVYLLNSPGTKLLHTYCPKCGDLLIEREFQEYMGARLVRVRYKCSCGNSIPVEGTTTNECFREVGFMDGYKIIQTFRMVHAVLTCLGILDDKLVDFWMDDKLIDVWREISDTNNLMHIHNMTQQPYSYLDFIKIIANKASVPKKGEKLIYFIRKRLEIVNNLAAESSRYKVYYCMGSPLFALNAGRMENHLVTFSGGISINEQLQKEGGSGVNVSPSFINEHNPDIIFVSGSLSRPLSEFYDLCQEYGIHASAIKYQRVYTVPPSWDFGNPRWILGLMYIADKLYPGKLKIELEKEADDFYSHFYGMRFKEARPNRSFHRPSSGIWPRHKVRRTHA